jgi:nitroimidazol reductase NimA-like FMN-containing flavoprotein (pyridoxamine 5'-phosphate oxidase superfamily)
LIEIKSNGKAYILDVYHAQTYDNLRRNPRISVTAVNEHKFSGYCLKGKARIIPQGKISPDMLKAWENRITSRLTQRLLKNIREDKGHKAHPEMLLPKPKYMIEIDVKEIVDLTPQHLK